MKQTIVILLVILVGVGAYLIVMQNDTVSSNNTIQEPTSAPITTPVVSTTQEPPPVQQTTPQVTANTVANAATNANDSLACAQQAKVMFDTHTANATQNGLYPIQGLDTYVNHFNSILGKCFMLETFYGDPGTAYAGNSQALYDVYDNSVIASYDLLQAYPNNSVCYINSASCTKAQFDTFLDSEMETTTY